MRAHLLLAVVLAIAGPAGLVLARDGNFAVTVQVVDRRPATGLLDAIPVPAQAQAFDTRGGSRSYAYAGTAEAAAAFYAAEMPLRGYQALHRQGAEAPLRQLWVDGRTRVVLHLQPVLGDAALTRIRVEVGVHAPASGAGASDTQTAGAAAR